MYNLRKRKSEQLPSSGPEKIRSKQGQQNVASNPGTNDESPAQEEGELSTGITVLSDEILIQIFSYLNTKTIVKGVGRACKRWNRLSKDKVLWIDVDIRFSRLNQVTAKKIFRLYCEPGRMKSLYMRAKDRRWGESAICLTPDVLSKLKDVGSGLERFGIEHEQMHSNIGLLSALPSQLTHLSLRYCQVGRDQLQQLLLPGAESLLKELLVLDLTGVNAFALAIPTHLKLPPKLHTLKLRNSDISLFDIGVQRLILAQKERLIELDISIKPVSLGFLWKIAEQLKKLEYFNLCGCIIMEDYQHNVRPFQEMIYWDDEEWQLMWGENDGVFESLKTTNLRNLSHFHGYLMEEPVYLYASFIHPDGKKELFKDNQNQAVLKDVKRKWREWKLSPLEQKYSFDKRVERDKKGIVSTPTLY